MKGKICRVCYGENVNSMGGNVARNKKNFDRNREGGQFNSSCRKHGIHCDLKNRRRGWSGDTLACEDFNNMG